MSTLPVKDCTGKARGSITLSERFTVEKGGFAVHQAVVRHHANLRQGNASTKTKGTVAGSGKKPWKQKGTGRARAGYRRSPVWRGGGVAFGPHPRSYRQGMNRKAARLALAKAFGERAAAGGVLVLDELKLAAPRTKEIRSVLQALDLRGKTLVILGGPDVNVTLAARNLQEVEVVCAGNVNTWQIVRYPQIVITKDGVEKLEQRLA